MSDISGNCNCVNQYNVNVVQCKTCGMNNMNEEWVKATQRVIQNQVRVPSSLFSNTLASLHVRGPVVGSNNNNPISLYNNVNWNQSSDRSQPSQTNRNVPSRGNSTRSTLTSCRPGGSCAGGSKANGVDIKHNSYDRYLLRKKSGNLRQKNKITASTSLEQAYYTKYGLLQNTTCNC